MKSLILQEPGRFVSEDVAPPPAAAGEALVRVRAVGVCGTDFHAFRGEQPFFTYPRVLGHEMAVEVLAGPPDSGLRPGDRCSIEPYLHCGACGPCRRGRTNCCRNLRVMGVHVDGGLREVVAVPVTKLHRAELRLPFESLVVVEPMAIGAHAVERAQIEPGEWAFVVGVGPIGLAVVQFATIEGARVIVTDRSRERLAFCTRLHPAVRTLPPEPDEEGALREMTGGDGPTVVFDATGSALSMERSFERPAHGGKLVFVGLCSARLGFSDPEFHRRELTLLGSRNARPRNFTAIIDLMESGRIDPAPWITHRASLAELPDVFTGWSDPSSGVVKAVVTP
jgi:2-desacetyl-2-hydroxyethyl bacteriochlorophyllide A dehydrogenase